MGDIKAFTAELEPLQRKNGCVTQKTKAARSYCAEDCSVCRRVFLQTVHSDTFMMQSALFFPSNAPPNVKEKS